jgi:hypothetical protein
MNQGFTSSWRSLKHQDTASRKIYTLLKLNRERERECLCPQKTRQPARRTKEAQISHGKKQCIKTVASK